MCREPGSCFLPVLPVSLGDPGGGCVWFHGHSHGSGQGVLLPHTHTPFPTQPTLPLPGGCGQNPEPGPVLLCDLRPPLACLWPCSSVSSLRTVCCLILTSSRNGAGLPGFTAAAPHRAAWEGMRLNLEGVWALQARPRAEGAHPPCLKAALYSWRPFPCSPRLWAETPAFLGAAASLGT